MEKNDHENLYNDNYNINYNIDYNNLIYNIIGEDEYSDLTKEDLLKMSNWYIMIQKIPDYIQKEKQLYSKVKVNSKIAKIFFELKRIYKYLADNYLTEEETSSVDYLLKYYEFILKNDSIKPEKLEAHYNKLLKLIIRLEIKFNMKIGLYEEFVNYYEQYNSYYGKKKSIINQKKILDNYLKNK